MLPRQCAVIFDVDGVLVDSYRAHFRSWQILAAENDYEYSEKQFLAGFGRTSPEVIREQWVECDLTKSRIQELANRKEAIYRELIANHFTPLDGAVELIEALDNAGIRLAVGSSGPPENVQLVMEKMRIEKRITVQITGADVTHGKPDPQVFQLAAERLGVSPASCVVVEDAPAGIIAAKAAGMKCIGVASTGRTLNELKDADLVVQSLRALEVERIRELIATPEVD